MFTSYWPACIQRTVSHSWHMSHSDISQIEIGDMKNCHHAKLGAMKTPGLLPTTTTKSQTSSNRNQQCWIPSFQLRKCNSRKSRSFWWLSMAMLLMLQDRSETSPAFPQAQCFGHFRALLCPKPRASTAHADVTNTQQLPEVSFASRCPTLRAVSIPSYLWNAHNCFIVTKNKLWTS